jgi:hypothetical protein
MVGSIQYVMGAQARLKALRAWPELRNRCPWPEHIGTGVRGRLFPLMDEA